MKVLFSQFLTISSLTRPLQTFRCRHIAHPSTISSHFSSTITHPVCLRLLKNFRFGPGLGLLFCAGLCAGTFSHLIILDSDTLPLQTCRRLQRRQPLLPASQRIRSGVHSSSDCARRFLTLSSSVPI